MMRHWLRLLIGLVAAIVIAGPMATSAGAADTRTGNSVSVDSDEVANGDLYIFGDSVRIAGTVTGDLFVVARRVSISGTVSGSVTAAAQSLKISGTVENTVRLTGGDLMVSGSVQGDVVTGSKSTTVTRGASIGGDVYLGAGDAAFRGSVGGDVRGSADELTVDAPVTGSILVSARSLTLTRNARVGGNVRYASDEKATISSSAVIAGQTERTSSFRATGGPEIISVLTGQFARLIIGLVTGLILLFVIPGPIVATADVIRGRWFGSVAAGVVGLITWPVAVAVLAVLVVGIPLALIGTALFVCFAWLSQIFVGLAIGRLILPGRWKQAARGYNILALALGMILIGAARAAPVPYLSLAVAVIVMIIGIGGVLITVHMGATALRRAPARV
jgi:cytoskeletal protein CcmA (bactofilin family)